ncbi:Interstitial collagenase [Camponotus floridanus]|uniref:Interstitial collagenase n=1 Tax=Camponotus floridanus TaxID=104421 RepID=E2A3S8_CAMFO|nr:Interstitial collagenase [Camponotus floridanus]
MTRVALSLALTISLLAAVAATLTYDDVAEAFRYLRTYGFLENEENHQQSSLLDNATALSEALSLFQEYYGLPGNGVLTVETIRVMRRPRCGAADIHAYSPLTRKWPRTHLTWNFKLANRDTLRTTQSAFALWSEQSSLMFSRDLLRLDILISYQSGAHAYENSDNGGSCPSPFAGPGSVVAHAFFPTGEPDQKREYYAYSEFIDAIISTGPFDLSILGIECPADGILHQLSELISKLYRLEYASFKRPRNDDDDD